jgi:hypothetical protein
MSYPSIEKIAEEVKSWDFIINLPQEIYGFVKQTDGNIDGQILHICQYVNKALKAKLDIIYTAETFDYIIVHTMGINTYRDVRYVYKERDIFAEKLGEALPGIIKNMENPASVNLGEMIKNKGVITWKYGNNLPEKIGSFELYIKPEKAIEHINGSIIIIDYTDFERKDQFVVYYNRLRNQFFAELKISGVFRDSKAFDSVSLKGLQSKLEDNLQVTLDYINKTDHKI